MDKIRRRYWLCVKIIIFSAMLSLFSACDSCAKEDDDDKTPKYSLTVAVSPLGSGIADPDHGSYQKKKVVTLTATANPGYEFDHWQGTDEDSQNPTTVTMSGKKLVIAFLKQCLPTHLILRLVLRAQAAFPRLPVITIRVKQSL